MVGSIGSDFTANPFPTLKQMRGISPIVPLPSTYPQTMWMITRMDEGIKVLKDARFTVDPDQVETNDPKLRREMSSLTLSGFFGGKSMLDVDEPDHGRLRNLVSKAFTPRYIESLRPRIEECADDLLDKVQRKGEMDIINDYAYPLPINVISDMLGVPENERSELRYAFYFQQMISRKRRKPDEGLISQLIQLEAAGDRLSEDELLAMVGLLIFAGHETTSNLIGNGTLALLDNPDQWEKLKANPDLIPTAVEELLRYSAPVITPVPRFAREDVEIGGQKVRKGDAVMVALASANRDDALFENPEDLDIARTVNRHIAFGQGIHYCLGAPLARLEGQIAFATLIRRMPDLRLNVPRTALRWKSGFNLRGLNRLPVTW